MNTPQDTYWTTKDGRKIPVEKLSDDHTLNCVRSLARKLGERLDHTCPDKVRLCQLINIAKQEAILSALTDPNQ
jgi:hypothetical protein